VRLTVASNQREKTGKEEKKHGIRDKKIMRLSQDNIKA